MVLTFWSPRFADDPDESASTSQHRTRRTMERSHSALMSPWKTEEDWEAERDIFTLLYKTQNRPLHEVRALMERVRNFRASKRQYEKRISIWGLSKYELRGQNLQPGNINTPVTDSPSSSVTFDRSQCHRSPLTDLPPPHNVNSNIQGRTRVTRMPRSRLHREADMHHLASANTEQASTSATIPSDLGPAQMSSSPILSVSPEYFHGHFFNANAALSDLPFLPSFRDSNDEFETTDITIPTTNSSTQAEISSESFDETDLEDSFGSSSSRSIGFTYYNLVEGEIMQDLIEDGISNHRTGNARH